jgi:hypothetical protein
MKMRFLFLDVEIGIEIAFHASLFPSGIRCPPGRSFPWEKKSEEVSACGGK